MCNNPSDYRVTNPENEIIAFICSDHFTAICILNAHNKIIKIDNFTK